MKRLTLVRHGNSDPAIPGQEDWDRPLNARGQRDAQEMARRLKDRRLQPDHVLTSPAVRALTTAMLFARELGLAAKKIHQIDDLYLAAPKDLDRVIQTHGGNSIHLLIVGHNPGLGEYAERLSGEARFENMPTASIFTAEIEIASWSELVAGIVQDAQFDYPSKAPGNAF